MVIAEEFDCIARFNGNIFIVYDTVPDLVEERIRMDFGHFTQVTQGDSMGQYGRAQSTILAQHRD